MFESLLGRGFSQKCKAYLMKLQNRVDVQKRKKQAVVGYLKKDIADLLRNGCESNAFARVEGLINEMNRASCYDWIGKFCDCILGQLSSMQKQGDCPAESLEAVSSVMFAAARFADLPELCDLRRLFTEKYGSNLESLVNQEFVEKIVSKPPSVDKKLQLIQDISQEFLVTWDSKGFKHKISIPSATSYDRPTTGGSFHNEKDNGKLEKKGVPSHGKEELGLRIIGFTNREVGIKDDREIHHVKTYESNAPVSVSVLSCRESTETAKPRYNNIIPPPYLKPNGSKHRTDLAEHVDPRPPKSTGDRDKKNSDNENMIKNEKPKPRSVRKKREKQAPVDTQQSVTENPIGGRKQVSALAGNNYGGGDEEEEVMDKLLIHYSKKKNSTYETVNVRGGQKAPPPSNKNAEHQNTGNGNAESVHPPSRTLSLPTGAATRVAKVPARASSFQPDALNENHVHPKLPDYDDLAARFAALKGGGFKG